MRIREVVMPVALLGFGILIGLLLYTFFFPTDGRSMTISANGTAEWVFQEDHTHGFEFSHGDHVSSPTRVKMVDAGGNRYEGSKGTQPLSAERTSVAGSIYIEETDLTPLDATHSLDSAKMEAQFVGPDGAHYRAVLKKLMSPKFPNQTFGGVSMNHLTNGDTGVGNSVLHTEYAYGIVFGVSDIYRNDELIAENIFNYIAVSQRSQHALNAFEIAGKYDSENPLGTLIVHFVAFPYQEQEDGTYKKVHFGVIGPTGVEQEFLHINFMENIHVTGNRFFNAHTVPLD